MFHLKARHSAYKAVLSDAGIDGLQHPAVDAGNAQQSLAWLLLVPSEKIAVVILSNYGSAPATKPIDEILSILLPTYRENLAKAAAAASTANAPAAPTVIAVPPDVAGAWSGEVQTYRGNVPLAWHITPTGEVEATLGKQATLKMTTVRASNNRVSGRIAGDLGIDYSDQTPYELRFYLDRHENKLIGAAVTYAMPGHDGPRLPFWVELRRARER